ncbi:DUF1499 domain-containing protein [Cochlodiniinecator piscidefendens]|uniref:DUF1499 domain-containing protein n=1 Tax=Cochlodiniinecator piscidefendens TaxID=2715756 RepID=UPI001E56E8C3|nr:DUF1499 domain-containing protein [Cochlodiniinecator piscidefendens]
MLKLAVLGVMGLAACFTAYVRLAPIEAERWHNNPMPLGALDAPTHQTGAGSYAEVIHLPGATKDDAFAALSEIASETPRTVTLAGSADEGRLTFVTRSRGFEFPDYTTVEIAQTPDGVGVAFFGRLRFGQSDFGVNQVRIRRWIEALTRRVQG